MEIPLQNRERYCKIINAYGMKNHFCLEDEYYDFCRRIS